MKEGCMDELIVAYYKAKDSKRTGDLQAIWNRLDEVARVIAEPLTEIPRGITEGRIRIVDSNFVGKDETALLAVEVVIEGRHGCREMGFTLDISWTTLDGLEPKVYADVAKAFGFQSRPQMQA